MICVLPACFGPFFGPFLVLSHWAFAQLLTLKKQSTCQLRRSESFVFDVFVAIHEIRKKDHFGRERPEKWRGMEVIIAPPLPSGGKAL